MDRQRLHPHIGGPEFRARSASAGHALPVRSCRRSARQLSARLSSHATPLSGWVMEFIFKRRLDSLGVYAGPIFAAPL